jgi:hypothetical protein
MVAPKTAVADFSSDDATIRCAEAFVAVNRPPAILSGLEESVVESIDATDSVATSPFALLCKAAVDLNCAIVLDTTLPPADAMAAEGKGDHANAAP